MKGARMEERPARAMLVSTADLGDGLTTVISRSEIEAALASEGEPIELVLDVTRFSDGEAGESSNVAVWWERFDLERMLEQATSENIALTFDRDAVWQAIATDVEAHGMREAAVTLAVAATVAAGAAGQASAYPSPAFGDSSSAPAAQVTGDLAPDDRAIPRPTPIVASTPDLAPDDRAVPRPTPVAATPMATSAPDLAPDDRATPRPTPVSAPVSGTVSDGTSWAPTPTETAVLAGAIALAISGAFFLVGGRRVRPRPA